MSDEQFFKEIQEGFLQEAAENLAQTESLFLSLEKRDLDHSETLIKLKRLAHNFKGSGKAVGFDELSKFSHVMENLLIAISTNAVPLSNEIVDLLLQCNDKLKEDIDVLTVEPKAVLDHSELIEKLVAATGGGGAAPAAHASTSVALPEVPDTPFEMPDFDQAAQPVAQTKESAPAKVAASAEKKESAQDNFIRIPMKKVDDLLNSFGEQVIFLSALDLYKENLVQHQDDIIRTIFNLKKIAFDLQQSTMSLRMINMKSLFSKLERAVRDSARITNKKVYCEILGADNELDKSIVEQLSDPLTHMVRNSVDRGIETPEERDASGKLDTGFVEIKAYREGINFVLQIKDDGRGMDPEKIKKKAIEKGLVKPDSQLSKKEIFDLIFESDFSTKEQVTEISGRGVGMNVVKEMIVKLKGTYEIESEVGIGTTFRIKLPLSLSLYNGLLMSVNEQKYLVPSSQVREIMKLNEIEIREVKKNRKVVNLRNEIYEFWKLSEILGHGQKTSAPPGSEMILVCDFDGRKMAFCIDRIFGIQRVVQKTLSPEMQMCPGASGVTILGDGLPAVILDLRLLAERFQPLLSEAAA